MKGSAILLALTVMVAGCGGGTDADAPQTTASTTSSTTTTVAPPETIAVIADYSPTVSDVGGLMYLLLHPGIDVEAITLPATGEAGCEFGVDVTLRILTLLDRTQIPVACDEETPDGFKPWPAEFLRQQGNLLFLLPEPETDAVGIPAAELIAQVLASSDRPVTIWAVAPLTNVARLLDDDPDAASNIDRIVIMGGAVDVPGNVFDSPAEWNIYIDSEAASRVFASGIPITLVPLDATNDAPVPIWYSVALERSRQSDAIAYLGWLARLFPLQNGLWYLWDELAAAEIAVPGMVALESAELSVVVGGPDDGRTLRDPQGTEISFASGIHDPNAFYAEFLGTLAGAAVPVGRAATDEEVEYVAAVNDSMAGTNAAIESLYAAESLADTYDPELATSLLRAIAHAADDTVEGLSALDPPDSLATAHSAFVVEFGELATMLDRVAAATGDVASLEDLFARFGADMSFGSCAALKIELSLVGLEAALPC